MIGWPVPAGAAARQPIEQRAVAEQFAALLFAQMLKPMAAPLGFYGDAVLGMSALAVARSERDGLTGLFERALAGSVQ